MESKKNSLYISMYHYVRDLKNSRYPDIKGLDVDLFYEQMMFFKTPIRLNYKPVQDSEADQKPLVCIANSADVTKDYRDLAKEIEKRIKKEEKNG